MMDVIEIIVGLLMILDVYVIIFFRLLVRRDYEQQTGERESSFAVIFSAPRPSSLSDSGRAALSNYWIAMGFMALLVAYVGLSRYLSGTFSVPT